MVVGRKGEFCRLFLISILLVSLDYCWSDECENPAHFFYDIDLSLSTYPKAKCNSTEAVEISTSLQGAMNNILGNLPEALETSNKICKNAIGKRQRKLAVTEEKKRRFLPQFLYAGGGRCRYCFQDDDDRVRLLEQNRKGRQLLSYGYDDGKYEGESVAHVLLCRHLRENKHYETTFDDDEASVSWSNGRLMNITGMKRLKTILGPYTAGESFGKVFHLAENQRAKRRQKSWKRMEPVVGAVITFQLWAFDVPARSTRTIFGDKPLIMFINGVKIDFKLLLRSRSVETTPLGARVGTLIDGIKWSIREMNVQGNIFGKRTERMYRIRLYIKDTILGPSSELDTRFMIDRQAKAIQYGINYFNVNVQTASCRIHGVFSNRFWEFKKTVEPVLKRKLGLHLARKFQLKEGHCLENKIPLVKLQLTQRPKRLLPLCLVEEAIN